MLRLIYGRSGFGKTYTVMQEIAAWSAAHEHDEATCVLIVPEQVSFETERTLVRRLGDRLAARVRVLSFTRLSETLMKSRAVRVLSNGAKVLLMSRAMKAAQDHLLVLRGANRVDTVAALLELSAECRRSSVTPDQLLAVRDRLPVGTLSQKTTELALLLQTYEALASAQGHDAKEDLSLLAQWLKEHPVLTDAAIYVDGFKGFTTPELEVLAALMGQAATLTVTLCTDRLHDDTEGMDRFSVVMQTANRLIQVAAEQGCPVDKDGLLMKPYRFQNAALEALEATVFTSESFEVMPSDAVTLTRCGDIYEESRYVANTIRRLFREEGIRARDIAVVARDLSEYNGVLDAAFDNADIPYYLDRRAPVVSEGVVAAVLTALRIVTGGWRTELLLQLMKTGLLGFSVSSASLVENYAFTWRLNGAQFKSEWTASPGGFEAKHDEREAAQLRRLNRLRRRLVRPLLKLQKALEAPLDGEAFARAVYTYIIDARMDRLLRRQIARLARSGEPALAEHTAQVWDALMALLDDMAAVLSAQRLDPKEAVELLHAAAVKTDIGSIPQTLDAVQIGAADRMRFTEPAVVFVLGANEGVFPALPSGQGILTDRERRQLIEQGVGFEDDREWHASTEQFIAYAALSAATRAVYVSYLSYTPDGEHGEPSAICRSITAHLPFVKEQAACRDDGSDIETADEAFERMASGFHARTPLSRALYNLLWQDEAFRPRLQTMTRIAKEQPIVFEDSAAAKRFFGERMVLSASRVEQYHQCRFAYFCRYGLRALPRRAAELGAIEFGTLTHYVMEHTLPLYIEEGIRTIRKARCFDDAATVSERFVEEEMGGLSEKNDRFRYLFTRLQKVCGNFLWQAVRELSQSRFTPVDYELGIDFASDDETAVKPWMLALPDGARITMVGKIDRVDVCDIAGQRYIRVVDYKTGQKEFRLEDIVEGINLQMLIYMLTLWKNGSNRYGAVLPAGLLYMPSKTPTVKTEGELTQAELEREQTKAMRMNGLLLSDEQVLRAMEPEVQGVFIPVKLKKDGTPDRYSSVATLAQFGELGHRAEKLLSDMAQTLRDGDVDARPFVTAKNDPCRYCDYRAVCGHETEDRVREPRFDSKDAVLAALAQQEGEDV